MAYLGNAPGVESQRLSTSFVATAAQTNFNPVGGYTLGYVDVYLNGVKLVDGVDFTAADGVTVVLTTGASSGDNVELVTYTPRGLSDGYTKTEADGRYVNVTGDTMTGALDVQGTVTADGLTVDKGSEGTYATISGDNASGGRGLAFTSSTNNASVGAKHTLDALSGNGAIAFATGSTTRALIDYTGDISFYESTGTTAKLFWDASAESLGIGTSSPIAALSVGDHTNTSGSTADVYISGDQVNADGYFSRLMFRNSDQSGGSTASIRGERNSTNFGTALSFYTNGTGSAGDGAERARIDSSGNLLVGTSSANGKLTVNSGTGALIASLTSTDTNGGYIYFGSAGGGSGYMGSSYHLISGVPTDDYFAIRAENGLDFAVGSTRHMRIDSSGRLGLGTSSPSSNTIFHAMASDDNAMIRMQSSTDSGTISIGQWDGTTNRIEGAGGSRPLFITSYSDSIRFGMSGSENMRIDSSGNLLVGTNVADGIKGLTLKPSTYATSLVFNAAATANYLMYFRYYGTNVGTIYTTNTSTSYNTSSDYRLKEDVQDMIGATDRVMALKPCNFAWKSTGERVDGFLAHEAQAVVPEAVHGVKDGMRTEEYEISPAVEATYDEEGNELTPYVPAVMGTREVPEYQGIDQSKLVPLLTKALQEALERIETLEGRVAALEAN